MKICCQVDIFLPRTLQYPLNNGFVYFCSGRTISFNKYCYLMLFDILTKAVFVMREFVKSVSPE